MGKVNLTNRKNSLQPLPLNASCWVEDEGKGTLYVRLRGAKAAVQAACQYMGGTQMDPVQAAADWVACKEQQLPWFRQRAADHVLWRLSVPQTAPALALPAGIASPLVEWHGALRWVQAPRSMGETLKTLAQSVGGSASLFRAEDEAAISAEAIFDPRNVALQRVHANLKQAFDPAGIFNPGRAMAFRPPVAVPVPPGCRYRVPWRNVRLSVVCPYVLQVSVKQGFLIMGIGSLTDGHAQLLPRPFLIRRRNDAVGG